MLHQNWDLQDLQRAIAIEQERAKEPLGFKVKSVKRLRGYLLLEVTKKPGPSSGPLDESLEEARAWWPAVDGGRAGVGQVKAVNPDDGELVIRPVDQATIELGSDLRIYPVDYLQSLRDKWACPDRSERALRLLQLGTSSTGIDMEPYRHLPLRERQREAMSLSSAQIGLLHGPPGTGKTYTLGMSIAHLVTHTPWQILISATTNTAIDQALLSADDALRRVGRNELRPLLTRMGGGFDAEKFRGREHLLPGARADALEALAAHKMSEPDKREFEAWIAWKDAERALRSALKADLTAVFGGARVIAATSASILHNFDAYDAVPWRFLVVDEASQLPAATAVMLATLSERVLFAGDPRQLPAVVQSEHPLCRHYMMSTAFDVFEGKAPFVRLNEQSRMSPDICELVSKVFYRGELSVAADKLTDRSWKAERTIGSSADEIESAIVIRRIDKESQWSAKYQGRIRYDSAVECATTVERLIAKGVAEEDIWALTPYRAQRALLRNVLYAQGRKKVAVSTVHRAQGGERRVVIFDPVDAGGKFLNGELGDRLLNVALSRAMAQVVVLLSPGDLSNQRVAQIEALARAIGDPTSRSANMSLADLLRTFGFGEAAVGKRVRVADTVGEVLAFERDGSVVVVRCMSTGSIRKYRTRMAA